MTINYRTAWMNLVSEVELEEHLDFHPIKSYKTCHGWMMISDISSFFYSPSQMREDQEAREYAVEMFSEDGYGIDTIITFSKLEKAIFFVQMHSID